MLCLLYFSVLLFFYVPLLFLFVAKIAQLIDIEEGPENIPVKVLNTFEESRCSSEESRCSSINFSTILSPSFYATGSLMNPTDANDQPASTASLFDASFSESIDDHQKLLEFQTKVSNLPTMESITEDASHNRDSLRTMQNNLNAEDIKKYDKSSVFLENIGNKEESVHQTRNTKTMSLNIVFDSNKDSQSNKDDIKSMVLFRSSPVISVMNKNDIDARTSGASQLNDNTAAVVYDDLVNENVTFSDNDNEYLAQGKCKMTNRLHSDKNHMINVDETSEEDRDDFMDEVFEDPIYDIPQNRFEPRQRFEYASINSCSSIRKSNTACELNCKADNTYEDLDSKDDPNFVNINSNSLEDEILIDTADDLSPTKVSFRSPSCHDYMYPGDLGTKYENILVPTQANACSGNQGWYC